MEQIDMFLLIGTCVLLAIMTYFTGIKHAGGCFLLGVVFASIYNFVFYVWGKDGKAILAIMAFITLISVQVYSYINKRKEPKNNH